MIESGQRLDVAVIDKMVKSSDGNERSDRDLKITAIITCAVSPGMVALGWFMSRFNDKIFRVMLGVALLIFFVATGLFTASKVSRRWRRNAATGGANRVDRPDHCIGSRTVGTAEWRNGRFCNLAD